MRHGKIFLCFRVRVCVAEILRLSEIIFFFALLHIEIAQLGFVCDTSDDPGIDLSIYPLDALSVPCGSTVLSKFERDGTNWPCTTPKYAETETLF
jgi:hypothetical protein